MLEAEAKAGDTRGPECVEKVWDEQVDGAWAPGKAPVSLLTTFLKSVQERNSVEAERAALEILKVEPNNRLVQDLLDAMKQHDAMAEAEEGTSEEDDDDDEEESSDEDEDGDEEESEEEQDKTAQDAEAKNNDGE